jgi:transposase
MERAEAEAIYEQGRETVVAVLLELSSQNALLRQEVAELRERVAKQEERIAELERRLNRNSRNSSLPPSLDPPAAPERRPAPSSGRKAGAQPGHPGHGRHLAPLAALDAVIEHWPTRCACGHRFSVAERRPIGQPARHQVAELPAIAVILSEHRLQRLRCPDCGAETRAALPPGVPPGAFGPRLQAAVATLAVRNRVSRRDTTELLRELFGVQLSSGSVDAIVQHAAQALEEPYEELLGHIRAAPALNIDETGWRLRGGKRTLWGALTSRAAVFRIAEGRHRREAQALLGEGFAGIACSDRWWALRLPRPRTPPVLLGAPGQGPDRPQRGPRRAEAVRRGRPCDQQALVRRLGRVPRGRRPRAPA